MFDQLLLFVKIAEIYSEKPYFYHGKTCAIDTCIDTYFFIHITHYSERYFLFFGGKQRIFS